MLTKKVENISFDYYKRSINELADRIVKETTRIVLLKIVFVEISLFLLYRKEKKF